MGHFFVGLRQMIIFFTHIYFSRNNLLTEYTWNWMLAELQGVR